MLQAKRTILLLLFSFSVFPVVAQLAANAHHSVYMNLYKLGHFSFQENRGFNTIGFPIGLGIAGEMNSDWIIDAQGQYGFWNYSDTSIGLDRRSWFELTLGFQKRYFVSKNERLSINPRFGLGYLYFLEKGTDTDIPAGNFNKYQSNLTGLFFHFGASVNLQLSKKLSLFTSSNIRAGAWATRVDRSAQSLGINNGPLLQFANSKIDFLFIPIEIGLAYNFGE
jgi:hypothetical protein